MKAKHLLPLFTILLLLASTSCRKMEVWHEAPECIWDKVDEYDFWTKGCFQVDWYEFHGRDVYVFWMYDGHCIQDAPSPVFDGTCTQIGSVGGFYPNGQVEGVNFFVEATFMGTIYYS